MIIFLTILGIISLLWDLSQTLNIKYHEELHEINVILGPHPSDTKIYTYFIFCMVGFVLTMMNLPDILGYIFGISVLALEAWAIQNNIKLGLGHE